MKAWTYLNNLYGVAGARYNFDVAAVHPYACNLEQTRQGIAKFRAAMVNHSDRATPIWITEFAWGSGPPDNFCKNKGLTGQRDLLSSSFTLILQNRTNWNIQRLFWFLWRDPPQGSEYASLCSICGTAGLLRSNRTAKPAYNTFRSFTAETTPPAASITAAPTQGSFINDRTPTFSFASNEAGSTFVCRFDAAPFTACSSPYTRGTPLADGAHTFSVKAIDAPGNESADRVAILHRRHRRPPDHDHLRAHGVDHGHHPQLQLHVQRVGLDLHLSLRLPGVRPLLWAGRQPHPLDPAHPRQPQLRRPGHRQGRATPTRPPPGAHSRSPPDGLMD